MNNTKTESVVDSKEPVTIALQGNVTIKKINAVTGKADKKTQKHNSGKVPFFDLIVQCIAKIDATSGMPQYIRGFDASLTPVPTTTSFISYNNPVITKNLDSASVRFEFLIPFTQISTTTSTNKFRLYGVASDNAQVFAEVDLGENPIIGDGQTNYLVIWTITVGNATIAII